MASVHVSYVNSTSDLTYDYDHYLIDATNDNVVTTLPQIINDGVKLWVCKMNNSSNSVTIAPYLGDSLNVGSTLVLNNYEAVSFVSYSGVWYRFGV